MKNRLASILILFLPIVSLAAPPRHQITLDIQDRNSRTPLTLYELTTDQLRVHVQEDDENYILLGADGWYTDISYWLPGRTQVHKLNGTVNTSTNTLDFNFATTNLSRHGEYECQVRLTNATYTIVWSDIELKVKKSTVSGSWTALAMKTPVSWDDVELTGTPPWSDATNVLAWANYPALSNINGNNKHLTNVNNIAAVTIQISGDITANGNVVGDGSTVITNMASLYAAAIEITGDITALGNIVGDGSTIVTNIDNIYMDDLTADDIVCDTLTAAEDITANGNIIGDNSTIITNMLRIYSTAAGGIYWGSIPVLTNLTYLTHGEAAWGWGNHASAGYLTSTTNEFQQVIVANTNSLGSELISNGSFTNGSGWTLTSCSRVSSGAYSNTVRVNAGVTGATIVPSTAISLTTGKVYQVIYDMYSFGDSVTNTVSMGNYTNERVTISTTTNYLLHPLHTEANFTLTVDAGPTYSVYVDDISVREITDGDVWVADNLYVGGDGYLVAARVGILSATGDITANGNIVGDGSTVITNVAGVYFGSGSITGTPIYAETDLTNGSWTGLSAFRVSVTGRMAYLEYPTNNNFFNNTAQYVASTDNISSNQLTNAMANTTWLQVTAVTFVGDGSGLTGIGGTAATALTISGKAAENISIGEAVYISGATGQSPQFSLASNTNDTREHVFAIAAETKTSGQTILARLAGELGGLDTSGWSDGDDLYLSSANGSMTNVIPTSGSVKWLGHVTYDHGSQGKIVVGGLAHGQHYIAVVEDEEISFRLGTTDGSSRVLIRDANDDIKIVFRSDGKVGILTNTPATALDVNGQATLRGTVNLDGNGMTNIGGDFQYSGDQIVRGLADTDSLQLRGGTANDPEITLYATNHAGSTDGSIIYEAKAGGQHRWVAGGSTRKRIYQDGSINGIGNTWSNFVFGADVAMNATADGMADDEYSGLVLTGKNAGEAITQWDCVFLQADAKFDQADADAAGEFPAMGLACNATGDGTNLVVLTRGVVRNEGWSGLTVGAAIYLSDTAGGLTETAPSTAGDCVQIIGRALSDSEIYFNFSGHWLEVE